MENDLEKKEESVVENVQGQIETKRTGFSITSLILGIASLLLLFTKIGILAIPCGILAIIFGIQGKKLAGVGMAKAGFIMGIISLSIEACLLIFALIMLVTVGGIVGSLII